MKKGQRNIGSVQVAVETVVLLAASGVVRAEPIRLDVTSEARVAHLVQRSLEGEGQSQLMATASLDRQGTEWTLRQEKGVKPYKSADPDTSRIWLTGAGVHQNMTFPVHPDPISGMHCWHQAVRVTKVQPGDGYGDVSVDTAKSHQVFKAWLEKTRSAHDVSPDGNRRPMWLIRPVKPVKKAYALPPT